MKKQPHNSSASSKFNRACRRIPLSCATLAHCYSGILTGNDTQNYIPIPRLGVQECRRLPSGLASSWTLTLQIFGVDPVGALSRCQVMSKLSQTYKTIYCDVPVGDESCKLATPSNTLLTSLICLTLVPCTVRHRCEECMTRCWYRLA